MVAKATRRRRRIPLSTVLTPNIPEAEKIADFDIHDLEDMKKAAGIIHRMGCQNVLIKGGHSVGDAIDVLYDGKTFEYFSAKRIDTKNTHGTGCTYSSAIAANLALGQEIKETVGNAKTYVTTAITHALPIGKGHNPTHHFYDVYKYGLKGGAENE